MIACKAHEEYSTERVRQQVYLGLLLGTCLLGEISAESAEARASGAISSVLTSVRLPISARKGALAALLFG